MPEHYDTIQAAMDAAAEAQHGRLEGHVGAGAGLKKKRRHDATPTELEDRLVPAPDSGPEIRSDPDEVVEVRPGEVFGFLGPNGAGKTTAMRLLTGFLDPDAGEVEEVGDQPVPGGRQPGRQRDSARAL